MELYRQRSMPDLSDCSSSDSDCECDSDDGREFLLPPHEPRTAAEASHGRADDTSVSPSATPAQVQLEALQAAAARAQARAAGAPSRPPLPPFPSLAAGSSGIPLAKAGIREDSIIVPHKETTLLKHGPASAAGCQASPSDDSAAAASAPAPAATWVQQPTPETEGLGEAAVASAATLGLTLQPLLWMNCKSHWMVCFDSPQQSNICSVPLFRFSCLTVPCTMLCLSNQWPALNRSGPCCNVWAACSSCDTVSALWPDQEATERVAVLLRSEHFVCCFR